MNTARLPSGTDAGLYEEEADMSSVVSYPNRCNQWGDARYRGNCDGRLFKNLVLRYNARRIADPMMGSGTTQDVVQGLKAHGKSGIKYWGGDLKLGFNLLTHSPPRDADFIWIHPPYWNIVQYSDHPDDLSNIEEYPRFLESLKTCLCRCHEALQPGGRLAVLVADVRRRGEYTPLGRDVLNLEPVLGKVRSVIIKAQHNCQSDRKTYGAMADVPIKHEYCIVFQK